jgi:hypothetical protein
MNRRNLLKLTCLARAGAIALLAVTRTPGKSPGPGLSSVWDSAFANARFVSPSNVLPLDTPLWRGFPTTSSARRNSVHRPTGSSASRPSMNCQRLWCARPRRRSREQRRFPVHHDELQGAQRARPHTNGMFVQLGAYID